MANFLVGFIAGLVILLIATAIKKQKPKKKSKLVQENVPNDLGCHIEEAIPVAAKLEEALDAEYMENVKRRVLQKHADWSDTDYEWRLFELKRYFLLAGILKSVPMFSDEVDEIWHEMIMFTKEYESFSKKFFGSFLHHSPNMERIPVPDERALFDWMYIRLFEVYPNSTKLWGSFFQNPLSRTLLNEVRFSTNDQIREKYFRPFDLAQPLQMKLIEWLQNDIEKAEEIKQQNNPLSKAAQNDDFMYLLPAMVYFSMYDADNFDTEMSKLLHKDSTTGGASSVYACGAAYTDSNDHSGHSGCSSSGCSGSSCGSSCGGGCGSS